MYTNIGNDISYFLFIFLRNDLEYNTLFALILVIRLTIIKLPYTYNLPTVIELQLLVGLVWLVSEGPVYP